jgi:alcohol dehydrogenase (cytochrome c)
MRRNNIHNLIFNGVVALALSFTAVNARAQVTIDRLVNSAKEPQNWLMYSSDYAGHRFSGLDQINAQNGSKLEAKWVYQTGAPGDGSNGRFENTPLVVDGIMYGTGQDGRVFALDARTGRSIWKYGHRSPNDIRPCCGRVNRGLAILGDKVFFGTLDARMMALDAKTGHVVWDVPSVDYTKGYSYTVAPLAVKNMIIITPAGGEYGIRGFVVAYEADTGKEKWRFNTVPAPGEPGIETWEGDSWKVGGAPGWVTGAYDPSTNLIFWTTGNPSPSNRGIGREGDNLYADCLLAIDADTGKLKWYFQFTKHDTHDWDATQVPVIIDKGGKKLIVQANRNGYFYILDRTTGKLLSATSYGNANWSHSKDAEGRPVADQDTDPTPDGREMCPGAGGVTNWFSPSYDPQTGLFYVNVNEGCDIFSTAPQKYEAGNAYYGSAYFPAADSPGLGAVKALDPTNAELRWEFKHLTSSWAGIVSTAGGIAFTGDAQGNFIMLDAKTGKHLWHFPTGGEVHGGPMTYAVDGKQYVAVPAGTALFAFGLP